MPACGTRAKSQRRMTHEDEPEPRIVQIAGAEPQMLSEAARLNVDAGAQIIDINMGCPAKKSATRRPDRRCYAMNSW